MKKYPEKNVAISFRKPAGIHNILIACFSFTYVFREACWLRRVGRCYAKQVNTTLQPIGQAGVWLIAHELPHINPWLQKEEKEVEGCTTLPTASNIHLLHSTDRAECWWKASPRNTSLSLSCDPQSRHLQVSIYKQGSISSLSQIKMTCISKQVMRFFR